MNARSLAVKGLVAVEKDQAYSNLAWDRLLSQTDLSPADRSLATALFYGTLDRKLTLDFLLSHYLKTPITRLPAFTRAVLQVALFQIAFLEKIPDSAAVNEAVKSMKASKVSYQAGFVNGVLRSYLRKPAPLPTDDSVASLSVRYSCPEPLVASFVADYGRETTCRFLEQSLQKPPVILRVNTTRTTVSALAERLNEEGVPTRPTADEAALEVVGTLAVRESAAYREGLFHVQDLASQRSLAHLGLLPGERVLDLCAAPGGKTFTMAETMQDRGEILAFDLYEKRVDLIRSGARRLGLSSIRADVADATVFSPERGRFDAVLCDVPCSGLGVIRRKPEIKYKENTDWVTLVASQRAILENAAAYLKPQGRILYSTCTLRRAENEGVLQAFLDNHPDYVLQYEHTYFPDCEGTDGFFCARLDKVGERHDG